MTADRYYFAQREINAVRVRVGWFGRPVLQLRRAVVRQHLYPGAIVDMMPIDSGAWVDARRADIPELAIFLEQQHAPLERFPSLEPAAP